MKCKHGGHFEHVKNWIEKNKYCPKCSARQIAASFPLGSIKPCSKSHTERTSPDFNFAEVPPIEAAFLET